MSRALHCSNEPRQRPARKKMRHNIAICEIIQEGSNNGQTCHVVIVGWKRKSVCDRESNHYWYHHPYRLRRKRIYDNTWHWKDARKTMHMILDHHHHHHRRRRRHRHFRSTFWNPDARRSFLATIKATAAAPTAAAADAHDERQRKQ